MRHFFRLFVTLLGLTCAQNASVAQAVDHPDALVIEQLKKFGSNLSKPHLIDFHFYYFKVKDNADELAAKLKTKGFEIRVSFSERDKDWTLIATKSMLPDFNVISALSAEFDVMAKSSGGKYDGWETQVVE